MLTVMTALALAFAGSPDVAQAAPEASQTAPAAGETAAAKPATVKKVVCKRVEEELGTGSRLGTQSKICREVEVPAAKESGASGRKSRS